MIQGLTPPPTTEESDAPVSKSAWGGFPSPADDYLRRSLDLNSYLAPHSISTFFIRVKGHAMAGEKLFDGDLLIVDRSAEIGIGHLVIAVRDGEFLLRKLVRREDRLVLVSDDPDHAPIEMDEACEIWGRVMW
ncbi:MAG TPA: S24 family peptidase, partial [Blastocatellia bacterium]|nr:S24 family peptidase [Blastocatellia bacterium]